MGIYILDGDSVRRLETFGKVQLLLEEISYLPINQDIDLPTDDFIAKYHDANALELLHSRLNSLQIKIERCLALAVGDK